MCHKAGTEKKKEQQIPESGPGWKEGFHDACACCLLEIKVIINSIFAEQIWGQGKKPP
ncbi:hypothetical protein GCM10027299_45880 [Larkinella ripae]